MEAAEMCDYYHATGLLPVTASPPFLLWLGATEGGMADFLREPYSEAVQIAIELLQRKAPLRFIQAREIRDAAQK